MNKVDLMNMKSISDIFKQAQEMQGKMAKVQEELGKKEVEASSGGGMVTVVANGRQELLRIKIEAAIFESADKEMLEDLIISAANAALSQSKIMLESEMTNLAGGLNLSGLLSGKGGSGG